MMIFLAPFIIGCAAWIFYCNWKKKEKDPAEIILFGLFSGFVFIVMSYFFPEAYVYIPAGTVAMLGALWVFSKIFEN